jgi:hypothetical protein
MEMWMYLRSGLLVVTAVAAVLPTLVAGAKPVPISSVTASASLEQDGYTFEPDDVADGRLYTFWVAGGQGGGLSDNLSLSLPGNQTIKGMEIWNGCQVDQDSFDARARASKMTLKIGFGEEVVEVADTYGKQTILFSETHTANKVRIFFKGLYHGGSWDQIAISEIRFINDEPEEYLSGLTADASSTLEGGDYSAPNLVDTFEDTMWCEGVTGAEDEAAGDRRDKKAPTTSMDRTRNFTQEGGGAGEWFKVDLGGRKTLDKIGIVIGDTYDHQTFAESSRPAVLTVRFSDNSTETWTLQDVTDWQFLELSGKTANWVKFEIDSVTLGKRWNDTAVGEVRFWGQ